MTELAETSPHYIGLYSALVAVFVLALWLGWNRKRLSAKRIVIAAVVTLALAVLALFGSGSRTEHFMTTYNAGGLSAVFGEPAAAAQQAALAVALDDHFIDEWARSHNVARAFHGEDIRHGLQFGTGNVRYDRSTNFAFTLLEPGTAAMQRLAYVQALTDSNLLPTLTLVELYRAARTDDERERVLDAMNDAVGSPYQPRPVAGWIARELTAFATATQSPAIHAKLEARLASLQTATRAN